MKRSIAMVALLSSATYGYAGPVLIASSQITQGGTRPLVSETQVEFILSALSSGGINQASLGEGIFWNPSNHGVVEFTPNTNAGFTFVEEILTNGIEDQVFANTRWTDQGAGGVVYSESLFFGGQPGGNAVPDLAGYDLVSIRLIVNDFRADEVFVSPGVSVLEFTADLQYEFLGVPVPDAPTGGLLPFGAALAIAARGWLRRSQPGLRRT